MMVLYNVYCSLKKLAEYLPTVSIAFFFFFFFFSTAETSVADRFSPFEVVADAYTQDLASGGNRRELRRDGSGVSGSHSGNLSSVDSFAGGANARRIAWMPSSVTGHLRLAAAFCRNMTLVGAELGVIWSILECCAPLTKACSLALSVVFDAQYSLLASRIHAALSVQVGTTTQNDSGLFCPADDSKPSKCPTSRLMTPSSKGGLHS